MTSRSPSSGCRPPVSEALSVSTSTARPTTHRLAPTRCCAPNLALQRERARGVKIAASGPAKSKRRRMPACTATHLNTSQESAMTAGMVKQSSSVTLVMLVYW